MPAPFGRQAFFPDAPHKDTHFLPRRYSRRWCDASGALPSLARRASSSAGTGPSSFLRHLTFDLRHSPSLVRLTDYSSGAHHLVGGRVDAVGGFSDIILQT